MSPLGVARAAGLGGIIPGRWDLTGATTRSKSYTYPGSRYGGAVDPSGTYLTYQTYSVHTLHVHVMSTKWDVTTVGAVNSLVIGATSTGLAISPSGDKIIYSNYTGRDGLSRTLNTPWTPSGGVSPAATAFDWVAATCWDLYVAPNGTDVYQVRDTGVVAHLSLPAAWDVTGASLVSEQNLNSIAGAFKGCCLSDHGRYLYVVTDAASPTVYRWTLTVPWDLTTLDLATQQSFAAGSLGTSQGTLSTSPDGRYFFISQYGSIHSFKFGA